MDGSIKPRTVTQGTHYQANLIVTVSRACELYKRVRNQDPDSVTALRPAEFGESC